MKNFDLGKALAGYPVCTRDGHKARIICFDAKGAYPVVALVDCGDDGEGPVSYMANGQVRLGLETEFDLFMAHVKHDGLVNIYKTEDGVITSGRTFDNEEKARAYDMALESIKELYSKGSRVVVSKEEFETIFPELKESEDERIKRILHSISSKMSFHLHDIFTEEEFQCFDAWSNAWLEKQGQKPKKVSIWKHWKDGIAGCAEGEQIFLTKIGRIYSISSCLGFECDYLFLSELDKL